MFLTKYFIVSGKGESIWDRFCHEPGHIKDGSNGDITCDSYHMYEEDIKLIKNLGVRHFFKVKRKIISLEIKKIS